MTPRSLARRDGPLSVACLALGPQPTIVQLERRVALALSARLASGADVEAVSIESHEAESHLRYREREEPCGAETTNARLSTGRSV